jgi:hypothetical protein
MKVITYDDMYAFRIQCLDLTNNEKTIICQLKYFLYHNGIEYETINCCIYRFYNYIEIPITIEEIESVGINRTLYINNNPTTKLNNLDDENVMLYDEYTRVYNELSNNKNRIKDELKRLDQLMRDDPTNTSEINNILNVLNTRYNNNDSTGYIVLP